MTSLNDPLGGKDILLGYKGNSVMDCGYFYAPQVPLAHTPVVLDPNSFGGWGHYGKKIMKETAEHYDIPNVKPKKYRSIDDPWETQECSQ